MNFLVKRTCSTRFIHPHKPSGESRELHRRPLYNVYLMICSSSSSTSVVVFPLTYTRAASAGLGTTRGRRRPPTAAKSKCSTSRQLPKRRNFRLFFFFRARPRRVTVVSSVHYVRFSRFYWHFWANLVIHICSMLQVCIIAKWSQGLLLNLGRSYATFGTNIPVFRANSGCLLGTKWQKWWIFKNKCQ